MRKEKALMSLLQRFVEAVSNEAGKNPDFAARLDNLLVEIPGKKARSSKTKKKSIKKKILEKDLPDIYIELKNRNEHDFYLWLRDQSISTLKALIRKHDLDAPHRTTKWKDTEKLSSFINEQIRARIARGSGFMTRSV